MSAQHDDDEQLVRRDGSAVSDEMVHDIRAMARLEAQGIVQDEQDDPTPDGD